ncbi:integral membrane protein, YccS/YhfK family [Achromobacter denitrificans]|uniref:FUSC family protein n=1 Tax=Achromobacter denitrificans TaxID=32002 RepID=UPI00078805EC|nr:FUSC family protein [Achromobacter denitrificans]ASC65312.1 FUSC family protein [Achromobacter denitrificans]OLU09015.1 FUSC family protein [Achromobacter denitrificans]QCS63668.1 FUSC family protein [Achromobacter denitrificans]QKH43559.1 FUSC family protein [Achromobacter denitrificans]QKH49300.1 FUSC family protein [Achromobacter denitrificans]
MNRQHDPHSGDGRRPWYAPASAKARLGAVWRDLTRVNASDRRWEMPLAAALSSGLPLMVGAYFGRMDYGLMSSLGGMVFLSLPNSSLQHRMMMLLAASFGMVACYAVGALTQFWPAAMIAALTLIAMVVNMVCRCYRLGPPGSLFFIMATAIAAYTPGRIEDVPLRVGMVALGSLVACLVAFAYSLHMTRVAPPPPETELPKPTFDFVVYDSVIIGLFVGISLLVAELLQLQRPYWVPVSCLAIIQGASLRAAWSRQMHRILGTAVGLCVAWVLLALPLNVWTLSLVMMALSFGIETLVVRHYASAVVLITPLTIFLAEAPHLGQGYPAAVIEARFLDTVIGAFIGALGAVLLHNQRIRPLLSRWMRAVLPRRVN